MEVASTPQTVAQLRLQSERQLAIVVTSLMLVPGVLWAYVDASLVSNPATRYVLHGLRLLQLAVWIGGIILIRRARTRDALGRVLFAIALVIVAFTTTNAWLRPADNWMPVRTFVLISIGTFVAYSYRFRNQMIAWLALLAGGASLLWWHWVTMPNVDRVAAVLNFLIAGAIGMAVARNHSALVRSLDSALERERAALETRERALAELRSLEGIIPICAHCKNVRTEAGAWEAIERYVRDRSDAEFSHGICPACLAKHYPEE